MKAFIFTIIFGTICISSLKGQTIKSALSLEAKIIYQDNDSLDIKTILTNSSSDTIWYLSMSCGWTEFYLIDLKKLQYRCCRCDGNIPIDIKIPPHESQEKILKLSVADKAAFRDCKEFKIDFAFIEVKYNHWVDQLYEDYIRHGTKNLISSNYVRIK